MAFGSARDRVPSMIDEQPQRLSQAILALLPPSPSWVLDLRFANGRVLREVFVKADGEIVGRLVAGHTGITYGIEESANEVVGIRRRWRLWPNWMGRWIDVPVRGE